MSSDDSDANAPSNANESRDSADIDPASELPEGGEQSPAGSPSPWPILGRMIKRSFPYWAVIILVLVLGGVLAASRFARAYLIGPLTDDGIVPIASEGVSLAALEGKLMPLALIFAVTLVVQPLAVFLRTYWAHWLIASVRRDIDQELATKFLKAPLKAHRQGASGDFLSRSLSDSQLACMGLLFFYNEVVVNVQLVIGGGIALFLSSWQLASMTLLSLPLLAGLMAYFGNRAQRQSHKRQETQGDLSQRLIAILSGIKVVKTFQAERVEEEAYAAETDKFLRRHMKVVWNSVASRAIGEFVNTMVGVVVLGLGVWMLVNGLFDITIGTLTQFAAILVTVYRPIKVLIQNYPRLMESTASASRLFSVLDMQEEPADRPGARAMQGLERSIRFHDVHFDYGGAPILSGIDLEVKPGEVIAIVGRTGAGKSTLMDLLLRFHDPTKGSIEIDGTDLRDLARASFLDQVAVVMQEPFLFDLSVRENIRYGRRDATEEEIRAAAAAASADEFIEALPEGYDTPVGEFGLRLSGGQRQRLTIARAIVADPAILVFDEATSALDAHTESAVQAAIDALRGRRTIFLVAHRLSTIRQADRIVVLDAGRIAEIGDHDSLVAKGGLYTELIGSQAA